MPERTSGDVTTDPGGRSEGPHRPGSGEATGAAAEEQDTERTEVLRPSGPASSWFQSWEASVVTEALPVPGQAPPTRPEPETRAVDPVAAAGISQVPISQAQASADPATVQLPLPGAAPEQPTVPAETPPPADVPPPAPGSEAPRPRRRGRTLGLVVAGIVVLAGLLYGGDLLLGHGSVPRGVLVAGVPVGGLSLADAEQKLRADTAARTSAPVEIAVGAARTTIDPAAAGLAVDWPATMADVGAQPLNPITRIASFFSDRDVEITTVADERKLEAAIGELSPVVDQAALEGNVRFEGLTPVGVDPQPGRRLDVPAAAGIVRREWVEGSPVQVALTTVEPVTTAEDVRKAVTTVATPAVSGPVTITGEAGTTATLTPEVIAGTLRFHPGPTGGLIGEVDADALSAAVRPAFAPSETPGRDASLDVQSGAAVVVPSQDGRGVDFAATSTALGPVLVGTGPRRLVAVYGEQPAAVTTDKLTSLGITGLVSEFTTRGFAADSGQNIKRAAEQLDGTIVAPGETFSLNGATNPRDAAHGYVEAGIIEEGHAARGIGGGVSQIATTLYNAAYFAGMDLVAHKEHSFYISRYPAGREATVFDDVIDLKFRNSGPTGVLIQTVWTSTSITVRFYGTKYYDVTSATGPHTAPTDPKTITLPAGPSCSASSGAPGFTVTDTRTLRDLRTGVARTDPTHTVKYNPSPIVVCGG